MLKHQLFRIYGRECCSLPTAPLNASRIGKHTTATDRTFHWTMPSRKKKLYKKFWKTGPDGKSLSGNNEKHESWARYNLAWGLPQIHKQFCSKGTYFFLGNPISFDSDSVCMGVLWQATIDIHPKCLALVTTSRTCPCRKYRVFMGLLEEVTLTTWRFEGLNSMSPRGSQKDRLSRSFCSTLWLSPLSMVR